jgi:branched-chain amino acid aminotransferase
VLAGITRAALLDCARSLLLPVRLQALQLDDLPRLQESFITSASRGVLPLRRIDDFDLPGAPGPLTAKLMRKFEADLADGIELI